MRRDGKAEREQLVDVLRLLEVIVDSEYWAYTREFNAGKLDAARTLVSDVLENEFPDWVYRPK